MNKWIRRLYTLIFIIVTSLIADQRSLADVLMQTISKELGGDLEIIQNEELGIDYVKQLYSNFKYTPVVVNANVTVEEMAAKLESKISDIFAALIHAKNAIENMQTLDNTTKTRSSIVPCIQNDNSDESNKIFKVCNNLLGTILDKPSKEQLKVDYVLEKLKSKVWSLKDAIKQQYFISSWDVENYGASPFFDCSKRDHMLLWNNYMSRNVYSPRNIVLLLDHGGSLSKHHFFLVKALAKQMIEVLNGHDRVSLLAISNEWSSPKLSDECLMPNQSPSIIDDGDIPKFFPADRVRKNLLYKFIDGIKKGNGVTNHSLGLAKALQIAEQIQVQNETVMVLYISRGLLSSLTEAKTVLETMLRASRNIHSNFIINTCAVIDETRPPMYEMQFLRDVATQDYRKYNISNNFIPIGTMIAVNSSETIGFAVSHFYSTYNLGSYDLEPRISLPQWDHNSGDLSVAFSLGSFANDQFGLLGIDIYFSNLSEDILYFSNQQKHYYAFLTDLQGRVIIHPSFPCPLTVKQQLNFVDLSHFEKIPEFDEFKVRLLNEERGVYQTTQFGSNIKYTWRRVGKWYVICIVQRSTGKPLMNPHQILWPLNTSDYTIKLVYNDLGSTNDFRLCRHLNQVATLDAGSLYLSPSCFTSPGSPIDMQKEEFLQNYMTYLQDNMQMLPNPGLKPEIKDEVAALAYVLNYLRNQHLNSFKSKYIVRRYVASYSGVLQMFPGTILAKGLDPTKRSWFLQAVEHKNQLILTPPYLDEGGAGYIVTMAYAMSNCVVALDITYGYVFRILLKRMPFCSSPSANVTCFIMDDRGYLVYHPNLVDPNGHGPVEKQHIVHKESLVANDILNHKLFIQKMLCNSYGGGTVQRYYKLNTSFTNVLVNSVHSEHCVNYRITSIQNTNVFIGMVNATCNIVVTFCPCSIVDRLCLNCNRMEQKECECPCECPLELNKCSEDKKMTENPLCSWFPEHVPFTARFYERASVNMSSCFPATCSLERSHLGCLGITGCEWCKYDVDGSLLKNPFCASLATCFNGVVGSTTPYRNSSGAEDISDTSLNVPISFIVLFILGVFLILCMFYVYHRSSTPTATERLYLSSTQDNHLRMSDLNISDNYHTVASHRDKLLQDEKPDPISPYCVSSGYRRIALPADSDHGYSTMTQHDESEHMSLAPVELDSLEDDLTSDNMSVHTSVSGKPQGAAEQVQQFTCLPTRSNCIVVPVTVHRNMEAT